MNGVRPAYYTPPTADHWDDATSRASSFAYHDDLGPDFDPHGNEHDFYDERSSPFDREQMAPYRNDPRVPHSAVSNGYSSDPGSVGSDDGPTFVLEHLATFRVSPEADLIYPADGMRRLLHMEKTSGIWTQKMSLKVEKKWVFILSHENGDVVEKFPMELIREPTAFTSEDPKELYNNIFIFVVAEDPKRNYSNPTEMHIFQCLRVSAKDVVEDMKMFMSGKVVSGRGRGRMIPPPPVEPAPQPPINDYRDFSDSEVRGVARGPRSERSSVSRNDDNSSTSSEKYERDVAILNSCFDDIERFIARLQHTAAATRELERRRRSRKSKKKDIGDGLLSMRAKPPPERDFVDVFQKFKLSFNLLAKLKTHIHDPNAPELVHFLFTPLALIVDAARESNYGPNLPSKVLNPLLSLDAIDLLTNCLTSRETELWHNLGEAWVIARNAWQGPAQPYQPVFASGWAPDLSDEHRERANILSSEVSTDAKRAHREAELRNMYNSDYYDDSDRRDSSPPPPGRYQGYPRDERPRSLTPPSEYPQASRSDISQDSMDGPAFEKHQRQWLAELKSRGAKIVQVTYPRTANNDKELTVVRGEYLEVLDDSRKWWKAMNSRGQMAHVPHTIVTPYVVEQDIKDEYPHPRRGNPPPKGWDDRQGKKAPVQDYSSSSTTSSSDDESVKHTPVTRSIPAAPPPPPITPTNTVKPTKKKVTGSQPFFGSTRASQEHLNTELKSVLESFRARRPHLDITKTPDVYINQKSTAKEVQNWLELKKFSKRIQKQFDGINGEKMFNLKRYQLEEFCGKDEGARLDSQITIQRNISGYKTARSSELKEILEARKQKFNEEKEGENVEEITKDLDNYLQDQSGYQSESDSSEEEIAIPIRKAEPPPMKKPEAPPMKKSEPPPMKKPEPPPMKKPEPPPMKKPETAAAKKSERTNTFKDQIKKQRKKIIKN